MQNTPTILNAEEDLAEGIGRENEIYLNRFSSKEEATRSVTWQVLCRDFLQQFVTPTDTVLDIGSGDGHFLKNIRAGRRVAVDLSPHVQELRNYGIEVLQVPASGISAALNGQADVVMMSNFLEHLPTKKILLEVLADVRKVIKPGGMLLILQPNIRYVGSAYWDYIDHHIALTEHSLVEALNVSGYGIVRLIPRFLPYTAKSGIGHLAGASGTEKIISTYLKFPFLWKLFGQQTFVVASPR